MIGQSLALKRKPIYVALAFIASVGRPASKTRIKALMERGFHKAGDVENRLGYYVGQLGS
jgi:hypothetical protein